MIEMAMADSIKWIVTKVGETTPASLTSLQASMASLNDRFSVSRSMLANLLRSTSFSHADVIGQQQQLTAGGRRRRR